MSTPFIKSDRVTIGTGKTYELVGPGVVCDREGVEHEALDIKRAPLILQRNGSKGYEYQEGQKIVWFNKGTAQRGTFLRYSRTEMFEDYDTVLIRVGDQPLYTDTSQIIVDPKESGRHVWTSEDGDDNEPSPDYELQRRLQKTVEAKLDFSKLNWNGHLKCGSLWSNVDWGEPLDERNKALIPYTTLGGLKNTGVQACLDLLESGYPSETWLRCGRPMVNHFLRCPYCEVSEYDQFYETNGVDVRLGIPCTNPSGDVDNHFTLNVPSGKLLVANDLRQLTPIADKEDINGRIGCMKTTSAYAKAGMAHGFVGNSNPRVLRLEDGTYAVTNFYDDLEDGEEEETLDTDDDSDDYGVRPPPKGSTIVAGIGTDLWWYSIMDYDLARSRCEALKIDWDAVLKESTVVDVEPGVYAFTHYNDVGRDARDVVYADIKRVGDAVLGAPDTYLEAWQNQRYTAGQVLAQNIRDWPTLYLKGTPDSVASIAAAADHLMCVNGNGVDFHPNGHPVTSIDEGTVPIEKIPVFQGTRHWYPMSPGYSVIFRAAGMLAEKPYGPGEVEGHYGEHLNESFQELAYRVLQSIILYGQEPYYSPPHASSKMTQKKADEAERKHCRKIMLDCVKAFRKLCVRYPETFPQVDTEFTAWMTTSEPETWVAELALDPEPIREEHQDAYKALLATDEVGNAAMRAYVKERLEAKKDG